jgi:ATP-dependent Clp protease ATP-binding subunit ClpB
MNPELWARMTRRALAEAQELARRRGHQEVGEEHLLAALFALDDGFVPRTLAKAGVDLDAAAHEVERALAKLPPDAGGRLGASPHWERALVKAEERRRALNAKLVTVEHVLLGLMDNGDDAAKLLARLGVTPDMLLARLPASASARA